MHHIQQLRSICVTHIGRRSKKKENQASRAILGSTRTAGSGVFGCHCATRRAPWRCSCWLAREILRKASVVLVVVGQLSIVDQALCLLFCGVAFPRVLPNAFHLSLPSWIHILPVLHAEGRKTQASIVSICTTFNLLCDGRVTYVFPREGRARSNNHQRKEVIISLCVYTVGTKHLHGFRSLSSASSQRHILGPSDDAGSCEPVTWFSMVTLTGVIWSDDLSSRSSSGGGGPARNTPV